MTIFIIVWAVWFASEILLNRLFRSGESDQKNLDKGTIRIIWITIGIANSMGILAAIFIRLPVSSNIIVQYCGILIIISGMILRFVSIMTLGRFFTVDVTIRTDHKIKKDGVYRLIRHPSYTGSIISFIGFGISLNNWISLFVITVPVIIAMFNRIKIEENLLIKQFGSEYQKYMKKSYRLIPWIL
jgi:protein-S-isoprenylcysteine O-methyltransferase Ste14